MEKLIVAMIKESEVNNLKEELPELFERPDIEIKIVSDSEFEASVKLLQEDEND